MSNLLFSAYEFNAMDCGDRHVIKLSAEEAQEFIQDLQKANELLIRALTIITKSFGEGGYIPLLGFVKTEQIIQFMRDAGVDPVFYTGVEGVSDS